MVDRLARVIHCKPVMVIDLFCSVSQAKGCFGDFVHSVGLHVSTGPTATTSSSGAIIKTNGISARVSRQSDRKPFIFGGFWYLVVIL